MRAAIHIIKSSRDLSKKRPGAVKKELLNERISNEKTNGSWSRYWKRTFKINAYS
jgi:hypothetical protein